MMKTYFPINNLECDYLEITPNDDDRMMSLKQSIQNLNPVEKNIILLYVDLGSYRKAAEVLNIAPSTLLSKIKKIKQKLKC